jgi:non-reducing end alpha-L-arabinofuranosidase
MDAVCFGNCAAWGFGNGSGPWVMADLGDGLFAQGTVGKNNNLPSMPYTYVTAIWSLAMFPEFFRAFRGP